jgi:hypothetical protein
MKNFHSDSSSVIKSLIRLDFSLFLTEPFQNKSIFLQIIESRKIQHELSLDFSLATLDFSVTTPDYFEGVIYEMDSYAFSPGYVNYKGQIYMMGGAGRLWTEN